MLMRGLVHFAFLWGILYAEIGRREERGTELRGFGPQRDKSFYSTPAVSDVSEFGEGF